MNHRIALFALDEIVDGVCKTIQIPDGAFKKEIFVVFKNDDYFVYNNSCPHTSSPLDWMPDQFLNLDKTLIQCATHNALFRIEDGYCVSGPCTGQSLQKIPVEVVDDIVMTKIDEDGHPQSKTDVC